MLPTHKTDSNRRPRTLAFIALALLLLGVAGPILAAESASTATATADDGKSWGAFFGRTHVLFLHLPIGLLVGAFVIEFFGMFRRSKGYDIAAAWMFVLGFFASIGAVFTGLLLGTEKAAENNPDGPTLTAFQLLWADADKGVTETLGLHMWLGVGLMIFACLAAVLKVMAVRKQWPDDSPVPEPGGWPLGLVRMSLLAVMALMPLAGHLGGNLSKTPTYLFEKAPFSVPQGLVYWPEKAPNVAKTGEGEDAEVVGTVAYWNANIQPVMNNHCIACHYSGKKNGKLRLDSLEWAIKGGNSGPSIEAGDAEYSPLYIRVVLPKSHELFMPKKKEVHGVLTFEETQMVGEWIQAFDGNLKDAPKPDDSGTARNTPDPVAPQPAKPLIDPAAIRAIQDAGGNAQSLSLEQDPDLLDIKFAYLKTLDPEAIAKLGNTADAIAVLTFEGSAFDDNSAAALPGMPKLKRLNLKDTKITDEGIAVMPELNKLEWLNLFGTAITDQALKDLERYTALKKLYVTGTSVSAEGVAELRTALPGTEIYSDHDGLFSFPSPADPDPPANATPVNTVCPVSGAPVKDGFVSTFEGKAVGFCCNNCKGQFDANPVKFKDKITPPADPGEPQSAKPINSACPVSGAPIKDGFVSTFQGKTVGFCCNGCKGKFDAEPAKFAGKLP